MLKILSQLSSKSIATLMLLAALISCGPQPEAIAPADEASSQTADQTPSDKADSEVSTADSNSTTSNKKAPEEQQAEEDVPKPIFPALAPGEYCYFTGTDTNTTHARLTIDASDRVTGNVRGAIHNQANGYYTSFDQTVDGTIDGSNLNLDVTTWTENDKQNSQETWKVSDSSLTAANETLATESCSTVSKAFQDANGLEAKDLTSGANYVQTQQVFFDPGRSGTIVSDSVVRGDRDVYQLTAQSGQTMKLSITALEDNAAFDVVSPSSRILGQELTQASFFLPYTGDYDIIVGGTRGNASYELSIEIE